MTWRRVNSGAVVPRGDGSKPHHPPILLRPLELISWEILLNVGSRTGSSGAYRVHSKRRGIISPDDVAMGAAPGVSASAEEVVVKLLTAVLAVLVGVGLIFIVSFFGV